MAAPNDRSQRPAEIRENFEDVMFISGMVVRRRETVNPFQAAPSSKPEENGRKKKVGGILLRGTARTPPKTALP
jgi:hypothetical protein